MGLLHELVAQRRESRLNLGEEVSDMVDLADLELVMLKQFIS